MSDDFPTNPKKLKMMLDNNKSAEEVVQDVVKSIEMVARGGYGNEIINAVKSISNLNQLTRDKKTEQPKIPTNTDQDKESQKMEFQQSVMSTEERKRIMAMKLKNLNSGESSKNMNVLTLTKLLEHRFLTIYPAKYPEESFNLQDFEQIRLILKSTITGIYGDDYTVKIQDFVFHWGTVCCLAPSKDLKDFLLTYNDMNQDERKVNDKVFSVEEFNKERYAAKISFVSNDIALEAGIDRKLLKQIDVNGDSDLKPEQWTLLVARQAGPAQWRYEYDVGDDIEKIEKICEMMTNFDFGNKYYNLQLAKKRFDTYVVYPFDKVVEVYCEDLNLIYSEEHSGVCKLGRKNSYIGNPDALYMVRINRKRSE